MSPFSPAFIRPPFLNVKDVIDRAVDSHVIVVTSNVEGTIKFNGPLFSTNKQQAIVGGVPNFFFSFEENISDGFQHSVLSIQVSN